MTNIGTGPSAASAEQYCVGTLRYTRAGLFAVFGWLLWGDFCFTLMEKVLPEIYPLFLLNRLGASNTSSNILMTTIPWVMGGILCPIISFRSDRTRSRWGRRIPYMTFTAPLLCLFLVGLGFSDQLAKWLQFSAIPERLHVAPHAVIIAIIGFLVVGFNLFNDFVNSVYWYLFADVVPKACLGRFLGLFRMVGMGADILFRKYVFPHSNTTLPTYVSLFPLEKYGQFGSANALVRSAVVVVGGLFIGPFLDRMTAGGANKIEYRWMYAWFTLWHLMGMICLAGVYILWKRRGGSSGYTPPGSIAERERMGLGQTVSTVSVREAE